MRMHVGFNTRRTASRFWSVLTNHGTGHTTQPLHVGSHDAVGTDVDVIPGCLRKHERLLVTSPPCSVRGASQATWPLELGEAAEDFSVLQVRTKMISKLSHS